MKYAIVILMALLTYSLLHAISDSRELAQNKNTILDLKNQFEIADRRCAEKAGLMLLNHKRREHQSLYSMNFIEDE